MCEGAIAWSRALSGMRRADGDLCGVFSKKRTIILMMSQGRPQVTRALQTSHWDPLVGQDDHQTKKKVK